MAETPDSSQHPSRCQRDEGSPGLGVVRSGTLVPRSPRAVGCGSGSGQSGARVGSAAGAVSLTGVSQWQLVTIGSTGSWVVFHLGTPARL